MLDPVGIPDSWGVSGSKPLTLLFQVDIVKEERSPHHWNQAISTITSILLERQVDPGKQEISAFNRSTKFIDL